MRLANEQRQGGEMYPKNDEQFEECTISSVSSGKDGWSIERSDGWSFFVPPESPVEPRVGMTARFYGKGIGFAVRGLFLDGHKAYYRTEEEDRVHHEIERYGADAADWLSRWDAGRSVWSISMGGLGPGYEQCIQITCSEIVRHMLDMKYDPKQWENSEAWKDIRAEIEQAGFKNPRIEALGLSGAQWGAALNLACFIYRDGPRKVMTDDRVKDRHIQVARTFPVSA